MLRWVYPPKNNNFIILRWVGGRVVSWRPLLPDGVYQVPVTHLQEWQAMSKEEVNRQAFFEALVLQMKMNGQELDPRFFDAGEKKGFDESDRKEWESWVKNKVVRRFTPEEARQVDKKNVFKAPATIVG